MSHLESNGNVSENPHLDDKIGECVPVSDVKVKTDIHCEEIADVQQPGIDEANVEAVNDVQEFPDVQQPGSDEANVKAVNVVPDVQQPGSDEANVKPEGTITSEKGDDRDQEKWLRILLTRAVRDSHYKIQEFRWDLEKAAVKTDEMWDKFKVSKEVGSKLLHMTLSSPVGLLARQEELMDLIASIAPDNYHLLPEHEGLEKMNRRAQYYLKQKLESLRINLAKREQAKWDEKILEKKRLEVARVYSLQKRLISIPLSGVGIIAHKEQLLQLISEVPSDEAIEALDEE